MKSKLIGLLATSLLFLTFIVLSLSFQSTIYLYIASVFPLLIVPFLPDIRSNQYIKPKSSGAVRLLTMENKDGGDSDFLVILFEPGYVKWNGGMLFFNLADKMKDVYVKPDPYAATLTVLKYDLLKHRSKKNWIGISLAQLQERSEQLSYTTNEVNRLIIRITDIQELQQSNHKHPASVGRQVGA
ncbi:hypothetical protein [Paenibacillus roseipurpureus]|uniref:Uncharacterized protein n=1 Tax=Paenibacillus roseopurpureus TaxID=2918901 RepID=A0AA96LNB4_9BACL|nr:hypothetical protein [Paenibacillus sp. MBLB1832]WNR43691.1 hypothetical protein MJB10_21700 [Paenibacillus sp. MBLB1832]